MYAFFPHAFLSLENILKEKMEGLPKENVNKCSLYTVMSGNKRYVLRMETDGSKKSKDDLRFI